jgi:phenylalanyl-tRNA synthetase alpha subunit
MPGMKNQPREKLWRGMSAQAIFTPRERAARKRIADRYAARRYRARHPERVRRARARWKRQHPNWAEEWKRRYPSKHQEWAKRRVRQMRKAYLAQLLRQHGRPVTPETLAAKKAELQAFRTRKVFRALYVTSTV